MLVSTLLSTYRVSKTPRTTNTPPPPHDQKTPLVASLAQFTDDTIFWFSSTQQNLVQNFTHFHQLPRLQVEYPTKYILKLYRYFGSGVTGEFCLRQFQSNPIVLKGSEFVPTTTFTYLGITLDSTQTPQQIQTFFHYPHSNSSITNTKFTSPG